MTSQQIAAVLVVTATSLASFGATSPIPGWFLTGGNTEDYAVALDHSQAHTGSTSAVVYSVSATPREFGGLMQTAQAHAYRGKRIRFSAYVKTSGVTKWSGLWLRVDGPAGSPGIEFDNMQDRPIVGDTDWKQYSVVLDVPKQAAAIAYGAVLEGPGKVWVDSASIEAVAKNVPATGGSRPPREPTNLDFEQ